MNGKAHSVITKAEPVNPDEKERVVHALVAPYGGADADGMKFVKGRTNFHLKELPIPPIFLAHNLAGRGPGDPLIIVGEWAGPLWEDEAGVHGLIRLTHPELTERLWTRALEGRLGVSSTGHPDAAYWEEDGTIVDWGIAGVSLIDMDMDMKPKNANAIAGAVNLLMGELEKGANEAERSRSAEDGAGELGKAFRMEEKMEEKKVDAVAAAREQVLAELSEAARELLKGGPYVHTERIDERTAIRRKASQAIAKFMMADLGWLERNGYRSDELMKASEDIGSLGAFALKPEEYDEVIRYPLEKNWILGKCRRQVMTGPVMEYEAFIDYDRSTEGGVYGGVVGYWVGEGQAPDLSTLRTERFELRVHGLALATLINRDWLADAAAGRSTLIADALGEAASYFVQRKVLWGSGVGCPRGILSDANPALLKVPRAANGAVSRADMDALYAAMLESSISWSNDAPAPTLLYIAHPSVRSHLHGMTVGTYPAYMDPETGMRYRTVETYNDIPVWYTSQLPKVGAAARPGYWAANEKDVALVDFNYYVWADRQQYTMETARELRILTRQLVQIGYLRMGGEPIMRRQYVDENGDAHSWCVCLGAKA